MEINFKANHISSTYVKKYNTAVKKYKPALVNFVEINPRERADIKALKKIANNWSGACFANTIYKNAKKNPMLKTFALTSQEYNFEDLDHSRILGIVQLSKETPYQYCIEHLETKPEYQEKNISREYKWIGRRILHSLKKNFYDKSIKVNYLFSKEPFYMDNGFEFNGEIFGDLIWKARR